jgi:hypothetical protein
MRRRHAARRSPRPVRAARRRALETAARTRGALCPPSCPQRRGARSVGPDPTCESSRWGAAPQACCSDVSSSWSARQSGSGHSVASSTATRRLPCKRPARWSPSSRACSARGDGGARRGSPPGASRRRGAAPAHDRHRRRAVARWGIRSGSSSAAAPRSCWPRSLMGWCICSPPGGDARRTHPHPPARTRDSNDPARTRSGGSIPGAPRLASGAQPSAWLTRRRQLVRVPAQSIEPRAGILPKDGPAQERVPALYTRPVSFPWFTTSVTLPRSGIRPLAVCVCVC